MHPEQIKIVERIVSEMETGVLPWRKQFKASRSGNGLPYNAVSGRPYSGINVLVLLMKGYEIDGGWLTYKQAQECGGNVRKGEKSTVVFYFSKVKSKEKKENGDDKHFFMAKSYLVFHLTQCDNINPDKLHKFAPRAAEPSIDPMTLRNNEADKFIAATHARIVNCSVENASYSPSLDQIRISPIETYETVDGYYSTLFHELGHWTGKRLGRDQSVNKYSRSYGYEELIAELCSCFVMPQFALDNVKNNASYIAAWIRNLTETPEILMKAAAEASKAAAFLNAFSTPLEGAEGDEIELAA